MRSNGEVEGPPRSARLEPRVHTVFPHPRRHYRLSRAPPTIVRPPPPRIPSRVALLADNDDEHCHHRQRKNEHESKRHMETT